MSARYDGWRLRRYWRDQAVRMRPEDWWQDLTGADWLDALGRYQ